jgi:hypothetical protein
MYEDSPFEDVCTVDDWYDGPRAGFAIYNGAPHHYRSLYLDFDDWDADEDRFELVPVPPEVLAAGLEASAIFNRWDAVRQQTRPSDVPESEFGALPEDRERYASVRATVAPFETAGHPDGFIVRGRFELGCKRVQWRDDPSPRPFNEG